MEPTEIVAMDELPVPVGARAALVIEVALPVAPLAVPPGAAAPPPPPPAACTVAVGIAAEGGVRVAPLDAALVRWLGPHVAPVRAAALAGPGAPAPPCDGLPPVDVVSVPPAGRIVGLRHAAAEVAADGPVQVSPIGADGRWWHLQAEGAGVVAFDHADDPPTRLALRPDDALVVPPARTVTVPRGGAIVVEGGAALTHGAAVPGDVVRVDLAAGRAVVSSPGGDTAPAAIVVRAGEAPPELWSVQIGAPPGADPREVRVRAGGRRRMLLDEAVTAAWIAAPGIAEVVLTGRRLVVTGKEPGRTALVVVDGAGAHVVPLAVGR